MNQNKILSKSGWWILFVLSITPLVLWLFELPLKLRFSNLSLFSKNLGDIAGLCGMAMFSLVIILSARLKFFEKFFKGINESYTAHHFFGGLAFSLLLFHPLLLAYSYLLVSLKSAVLFLMPGTYWAQNFGRLGLFIMIVTLVITFYTKLKYQVWKFTHKFLGIAFIFAFLHTFLIGGDLLTNQLLKVYLFVLGITAIIAYFYRTLFADYFVRVFSYTVKDIKEHEDKIWEISLEPKNKEMKFVPGQFSFVKLINKELTNEVHPFSFSSNNGNPLKITIKELGDYTNKIGRLKVGDSAVFEGPFGAFSFKNYENKNQVWIAGGIGITPFLSMLRSITNNDYKYKVDLYYSVKDENCLAFKEEIEEISKRNKNLNINFWITAKNGFLTADLIKVKTSNLENRDILICGPNVMMSALKSQFLQQGIIRDRIHTEEFQMY